MANQTIRQRHSAKSTPIRLYRILDRPKRAIRFGSWWRTIFDRQEGIPFGIELEDVARFTQPSSSSSPQATAAATEGCVRWLSILDQDVFFDYQRQLLVVGLRRAYTAFGNG